MTSISNELANICIIQSMSVTQNTKNFKVMTSALANKVNMNNDRLNVYKKVLQEVYRHFVGVEEFIRDKIEEICRNEKLSKEEVIYFVYKRLRQLLKLNFAINVFEKQRVLLNL